MKYKILFFIIFFGVFVLAQNSKAANLYVDNTTVTNGVTEHGATWSGTNGTDYNPNKAGSPEAGKGYRTVQAAVNAMSGGDDIYLRDGRYLEHDIYIAPSKSGTENNWSSMQSYPTEWAIIDGQRLCNAGKTTGSAGVIENLDGIEHNASDAGSVAKYWIFERLEITGGGNRTQVYTGAPYYYDAAGAAGIWWIGGPFKVRYCYIHDNLAEDASGNPSGISGSGWHDSVIEYCLFDHNGSVLHNGASDYDHSNSTSGIMPQACWYYNNRTVDMDFALQRNEYGYNYIKTYGDSGIRTKTGEHFTEIRNGTDMTYKDYGDKIHHNIIQSQISSGGLGLGISYIADFAQIYNNIVDMTGYTDYESYSIDTDSVRCNYYTPLWSVIYNNTVKNGHAIGSYQPGANPYIMGVGLDNHFTCLNNILDSLSSLHWAPIAFGSTAGPYQGNDITDDTNVTIDKNYLYRTDVSGTTPTANCRIFIGTTHTFISAAAWSTHKPGQYLYEQQTNQELGSNKLWTNTSGAGQYVTVGTHEMETGKTIAKDGFVGKHPYLTEVTIPSYIGATDPSNPGVTNAWVAGVYDMNANWFKTQANGSTPPWVEGSTQSGDTIAPASPSGLSVS